MILRFTFVIKTIPSVSFNPHTYTFHLHQCKSFKTYIFSFVFVKIIQVHINKIHVMMNLTRSQTIFLSAYKSQMMVKVKYVNSV